MRGKFDKHTVKMNCDAWIDLSNSNDSLKLQNLVP